METNKEKKTITSLFINKIIEEFNKNENNINNNLIKPLFILLPVLKNNLPSSLSLKFVICKIL